MTLDLRWMLALALAVAAGSSPVHAADPLRELQAAAIAAGSAPWGHWGASPEVYSEWKSHSNRLVPLYAFGAPPLTDLTGEHGLYRSADRLKALYGQVPEGTLNPQAEYFDQTELFGLQAAAAKSGKKRIVLFVFDGLDFPTLHAAATVRAGRVAYREGRGEGLFLQDYRGGGAQFGFYVTSPYADGARFDVDSQMLAEPPQPEGGYDAALGGAAPWAPPADPLYLTGRSRARRHVVTDSASSATSMTSGIKTYNAAINVAPDGGQVEPLARRLQGEGWSVGVVTSVPISHATPAAAYANNVSRDDHQDLTRDLLGLPSAAHREAPLPGVDVLLGAGFGEERPTDAGQGANFVPGNRYLAAADLAAIDAANGGQYRVALRTAGRRGGDVLATAVREAREQKLRLFGFFGVRGGHIPFQTADGGFDPVAGAREAEQYAPEDIAENPTLAELTLAAVEVLEARAAPWWLMVEAGDVDWANHDNNLDNSVGAMFSGDAAFQALAEWIEAHGGWEEALVLVGSDHGHELHLVQPEALTPAPE